MTCSTIAILAGLAGALFGYAVSNVFAGKHADDEQSATGPIALLEIAIDRAGDGERVWINGPHGNLARWYRVGMVVINDRRRDA